MDQILQPWLDSDDEPPDLYTLLGQPKFHDDLTRLGTAIREAHAVLQQYQRHPETEVQERARRLRNLVGQASRVFATEVTKQVYDAELNEKVAAMQLGRKYETVGIDLGTTFSALAYIDEHGEPMVVANPDDQSNSTASVVYIDDDDIVVGATALRYAKAAPQNVVQFAKRDIGEENARYTRGSDKKKDYTPETISAMILKKLITYSAEKIGPIRKAVVTVPAFFNGLRRVATAQAGQIAGIEVVATLNEPSAACIAYRLHDSKKMGMYVVYDLGGGTFDVTVMRVGQNKLQELASGGNRQLGGYDWDSSLADIVAEEFLKQHKLDPRKDPMALQMLINDCCDAKKTLSGLKKADVRCTFQGKEVVVKISRDDFERETSGLLKKTELTIEGCLREAGINWAELATSEELDSEKRDSLKQNGFGWDDIAGIMLVGGSTRMPMVLAMIKRLSGKDPMRNVDVDLAVALGAAIYAGVLETKGPEVLVVPRRKPVQITDEPVIDELFITPNTLKLAAGQTASVRVNGRNQGRDVGDITNWDQLVWKSGDKAIARADGSNISGLTVGRSSVTVNFGKVTSKPLAVTVTPADDDIEVIDYSPVNTLGIGVFATQGGLPMNFVMIPPRTLLPAVEMHTFKTTKDNASEVRVRISEGDSKNQDQCKVLGPCVVGPLPDRLPRGSKIEIQIEFDKDGRVKVTGQCLTTRKKVSVVIEAKGLLTQEQVERERQDLDGRQIN